MSYDAFLRVMCQLASKRRARIVIHSEVIFFEASQEKDHFTLYTSVYSGDGYLPNTVRSCVSSSGILRWQKSGAYLKLDPLTHSVYLFQEIKMEEGKYLPFRHYLSDFSMVAAEWREILQDSAEGESSSISVS